MTRYAVMGMIVLCGGLLGRAQEPAEPAPPTRMQQVVQVLVADAETGWHGQYGRTPDTVILSWRTFAELGPLEGKFKLLDIQVRGVEAVELPGGMSCDPQQLRDNPAAFVEQVLVLSFDDRALTFGVQPPEAAEVQP